ncbi:MAG: T9SS type A sorting domain-containing protein, partial [Bacteroidales bacterium]|nr:T9SS type A sorting domain-containing protein [Bacteroidales bacterium]
DDMVLNTQDIPLMDYAKTATAGKDAEGCEYLIIVPDNADFLPWADSIKLFRTEQGIQTAIVTLPEIGGNTLENIKNFIDEVYDTWDPVPAGVLLMADYGNDANTITSKTYPHPYSGSYITDNYFADYTGNDLPDFVFARMTGRNYAELETMVKKFIDYERTPPLSADFYNKPITALGWQTERWFQICSESVGGYMLNVLGKDPVRINAVYGGNPNVDPWSTATNTSQVVNYFGPMGQAYIPATPAELGGWTGGSATDVVNALNDGAFILQHRDHGSESGWGEPAFSMSHISQLNNVGELSHIFSINCLTGRFDVSGECFAEKFHRYTNGGALSLTAASQVSYSFVNDAFVWGMYDNMWPDFMPDYGGNLIEEREFRPAFGAASGKYFLAYTNWPYNTDSKQITYRLFHHHGDAFNIVYTEVPVEMEVDYSDVMISGPDFIEVQAEEGALIAFSVDGLLIGVGEGTGAAAPITIEAQDPGTMIKIIITKQNFFRHVGYIQVIAPNGPYIVKTGFVIDDLNGNANGLADFGEDILLDFSIKNLGTEVAENIEVSISCEDEYITLTDSEESYGNVGVNEEITHEGAFAFSIAEFIPDNHSVVFAFSATNGDEVWESSFSLKAYAPVLEILDMELTEIDGNGNGRIDAGEDAILSIEIGNSGRCASPEGLAEIFSSSDYMTINTSEFTFETIDSAGIIIAEFNISTSEDTPVGSVVSLSSEVEAGPYSNTKDFNFSVGLIVEDWETGDFSQFDWVNSGNANWSIDNMVYYEGENSAKSGNIGDNQVSTLTLTYDVMVDDQISFFYKVSSESGYDKLKFSIDGSELGSWSGEVSWTEASYAVSAGSHVFKWVYDKDGSVSSGSDCSWIDYIILPPMLLPTANAGDDAEICITETTYHLAATAADYESVEWTTSGDGTFSALDITDPIYTVGTNDISNGNVQLTITAYGGNGDATNTMLLSLVSDPVQPAMPLGDENVCYAAEDIVYTVDGESPNYQWFLTPESAGNITEIANNVYVSFNDGFSGEASISVMAVNACGESAVSDAFVLQVAEQATVAFVNDAETCFGSDATLVIELAGEAPWTVEMMDEDGLELIFDADVSPFEMTVNTENTMNYTLMHITDANGCVGLADGTAIVTVHELPTAILTADDAEVCGGDAVEVAVELTGAAPWNVTLGDGAELEQNFEVAEANESLEFIAPLESMELQMVFLSDANGCIGNGEGSAAITVMATPVVDLGIDTTICHNHIYPLNAQNDGATYSWSTGVDTQTIEVDESMADASGDALIYVEVTNPSGCSTTDEVLIHFKDCTGIEELQAENIQLMPNPNNGRFILEIPATQEQILSINIHNSLGELVTNIPNGNIQEQMEIDLSYLSDGVYFLIIRSSKSQINKRFVIRK